MGKMKTGGMTRKKTVADFPSLVAQWHPTKNGGRTPDQFTPRSNQRVWWICPAGPDHEWRAHIYHRTKPVRPTACPCCRGSKVSVTNSLATRFPEVAAEWHPTKNGDLTPDRVTSGTKRHVWWKCMKGPDHEWRVTINSRTNPATRSGCPYCSGHKVSVTNSLATRNPEAATRWHPTKNGELTPDRVVAGSRRRVWWKCSEGPDHEWQAALFIITQRQTSGCPFCHGWRLSVTNSLATRNPEVAAGWHPTKNGELTPDRVVAGSRRRVWWKCPEGLDHEWETPINARTSPSMLGGCPCCSGYKVSVTNSLVTRFPEVAAEWHPTKNGDFTPDRVTTGTQRKVWWKCPNEPDHEWEATINNRTANESKCPFCTLTPRSRQEILLAVELALFLNFDIKQHKLILDGTVFDVDILVPNLRLVVEYDGNFWHRDKHDQDRNKTERLQRNGYKVIRVREQPLDAVGPHDVVVPLNLDPKQCANLVLTRIEEICGISLPGLPRYLKRKTLMNSKAAEAYIEELLRESASA